MLRIFLYFCIFTLCLGQLVSVYKSDGFNLYLFDFAVITFSIIATFYFLIKKSYVVPKYLYLGVLFSLFAFFTLVLQLDNLSGQQVLVALSYSLRLFFYILAGIAVYNMLHLKLITFEKLTLSFILSGVFIAILGFIQLIVLPDFEVLDPALGWDPHKFRLGSTFLDPNFTGAYLVLCLSLVFYMVSGAPKPLLKRFYMVSGAILVLALLLTFSRSAWLMFGVVIFVYGIFRSRGILLLALLVIFLAYFAVPRVQTRLSGITDPADSAHFRIISWQNTLDIASNNLLTGVGYNAFRYAQISQGTINPGTLGGHAGAGSDSSFLLVLATTGVIGLTMFVGFYLFPILHNLYYSAQSSILLISSFGALFIGSQFINSVFFPPVLFFWISLLALANYSLEHK